MNRPFPTTRRPLHRSGFTLVEITVVLAIAALVSAIVFSGFKSMRTGNRRLSCQTNLIAIYQAARLYQADEGAFPYYDPDKSGGAGDAGIGLWQVYAYSEVQDPHVSSPDPEKIAPSGSIPTPTPPHPPTKRYLRNVTVFHCPSQIEDEYPGTTNLYLDNGRFNPQYLSYQVQDPQQSGVWTYDTNRTNDTGVPGWRRQLLPFNGSSLAPRPPADDTVVTWCPFHRGEAGGYDNVLFYDGSVDILPPEQKDKDGNTLPLWRRVPRSAPLE